MENLKTSPKDFFLHLLLIVTLYLSVGFLISLVFNLLDIWLPEADTFGRVRGVRTALSFVIVAFPAFHIFNRILATEYKKAPTKRDLSVRRWLIYLTLFIGAVFMIGSLIALLNSYFNGELTPRFLLKVLTVLAVMGGVFWHYLADLRSGQASKSFFYVSSLVVIIFVVLGVVWAGHQKAEDNYPEFPQFPERVIPLSE